MDKKLNLKLRMGLIITLMLIIYSLFIGVLLMTKYSMLFSFIIILFIGLYYKGSDIAIRSVNGEKVSSNEYTELHNRVNRISHQTGIQKPDIAVSKSKVPNAFITGRSENNTVLCVTEGLLNELDGDELDSVIAHELSHIKNKDVFVMMIPTIISLISYTIVRYGFIFNPNGQDAVPIYVAVLLSFFVWIFSYIMIRVLSKQREYIADRGASKITGDPLSLANALDKIHKTTSKLPDEDLREISSTNTMNFYPVQHNQITELMSTHPKVDKRISELESIDKNQ